MTDKEVIQWLVAQRDKAVDFNVELTPEIKEIRNRVAAKRREAYDVAIRAIEQKDVLEKIREEILDEAEYAYADFDQYKEDILHAEPDELPDDDFRYGMERAVEIINKYREGGAE